MKEPEINYKRKIDTNKIIVEEKKVIENPKQESEKISNALKNSVNNNVNNFKKGEFEDLFSINSEEERVAFIENYKLGNVEEYINENLVFPENHLIVIINTKKALLDLIDGKDSNLEYEFTKTLFMRMCDTILKFSQTLNKNDESKISLNKDSEIYKSLKIYTFNKNLEFFGNITEHLSRLDSEKFYLPLMKKCLQNSSNFEECNLLNILCQLLHELRKNTSVKNLQSEKSKFYIKESNLPIKRKFYRILFFSGSISELINVGKLQKSLLDLKNEYNIVFNYFLYEHDYQYEKNIYPVFLGNNLLDDKNKDFELFLKKEIIGNKIKENQGFINPLIEKISKIENSIKEFFGFFLEINKSFFKKQNFLEYQKKFDIEYSKLIQDYEIINKNNTKYYESTKAKINNQLVDDIKKSFNEMNKSGVINNLLLNVKRSVDFGKYNDLLKEMISQSDHSFDKFTNEINNLLISMTKSGKFYKNKNTNIIKFKDFL